MNVPFRRAVVADNPFWTAASVRHGCNPAAKMGTLVVKNYVDNQSNSPQYLGVASLSLPQLGSGTEVGNPFKGKSFTEETSCQQRKRLPRKRNTNFGNSQKFRKASREKHLSRGFLFLNCAAKARSVKFAVVPNARSC
jgi:hypothetical protein